MRLWPLFALCAGCATAPVKLSLPADQPPFDGCKRTSPGPSETVFTCDKWLANYGEAQGATPEQFRVEMARELKARLDADITEDTAVMNFGGKPTQVARYTAASAGHPMLISYFYVQSRASQPTRLISCTAEKGEAVPLARCELAMRVLVEKGLPPAEEMPPFAVKLFGEGTTVPADCTYGAGLTPAGGRVRCGERLMVRWDSLPPSADALVLDNFAVGLRQELGGPDKVTRDTPSCTFKGATAVCVRLKAHGGYTFLLTQATGPDGLLLNCGFRDDADDARAACTGLIAVAVVPGGEAK